MAKRIAARREMGSVAGLIERFGSGGYNPKTGTYTIPGKHKAAFDEMARPHRRLETARGEELRAESDRPVRLRHRDGSLRECSPANAERVSRMVGAVEAPRYRGVRIRPLDEVDADFRGFGEDERGYLYHCEDGVVTPTGHRHLPTVNPQPWVKAYCEGCA